MAMVDSDVEIPTRFDPSAELDEEFGGGTTLAATIDDDMNNNINDPDVEVATSFDPCAEAAEFFGATNKNYVHIRVQQRNGKKCVTTVSGINQDFNFEKIVKEMKRDLFCNGHVVEDKELGKIIQLQGDQRLKVRDFLCPPPPKDPKKKPPIVEKELIKMHGY
ncbi:Translation initiation factor SUI1 [Corchorus capsularis]|uniref:Translation initiation factor SUI1 n=1 Tax=Corchorus capsularis TaxID=210143 RepID=A0A1R3ILN7_COCAP|nr:Translation initiation factor SUI1 [Corchorus capsularis]